MRGPFGSSGSILHRQGIRRRPRICRRRRHKVTSTRLEPKAEGAPYNGLRGDEYTPDPAITLAEKALESGSLESVEKSVSAAAMAGLRERFAHAHHAKEEAGRSTAAGREYVHAYAEFLHYVQGLHEAAKGGAHHEE